MNHVSQSRKNKKQKKYQVKELVKSWSVWESASVKLGIKYINKNLGNQLKFNNLFSFIYRNIFNNNVNLRRFYYWQTFFGYWFIFMPIMLFILYKVLSTFTNFDLLWRWLSLTAFLITWIICRANYLRIWQWYFPAGHKRSRIFMVNDLKRSNKYLVKTPLRKHYILRKARTFIKIRSVEPFRLWHIGQTNFYDWNFVPPDPLKFQWKKPLDIFTNSKFTLYHQKGYYKHNLVVNPICYKEEDQLILKNYIIKNKFLNYYQQEFLEQNLIQIGGFVEIKKIYSSYYVYDNITDNQIVLACHALCWTNKLGITFPILALGPWFVDITTRKPWFVLLDMQVYIDAFDVVGHYITSDIDKLRINSCRRDSLIAHGNATQLPYYTRFQSVLEEEIRKFIYKYYQISLKIVTQKWPKTFKKYYNKKKLRMKTSFIFFFTSRYKLIIDYWIFLKNSEFTKRQLLTIQKKLLNVKANFFFLLRLALRYKRKIIVFSYSIFRYILKHYNLRFKYLLKLKFAWVIKESYILLKLYDWNIWYQKKIVKNWWTLKVFCIYSFFIIYYALRQDYRRLWKRYFWIRRKAKEKINRKYKKYLLRPLQRIYKPIAKYIFTYVEVRLVFLLEERQNFINFAIRRYKAISTPIWKFIKKYFYTDFVEKYHLLYSAVFFKRFLYFWWTEFPFMLTKFVFPGIKYFYYKFIPLLFNDLFRIIPIVLFELGHVIPVLFKKFCALNSEKKFKFNLNKSLFSLPTPQSLWTIRTNEEFSNAYLFRARRRILGNFKSNRSLSQQKLLFQAQALSYTNLWSNVTYDSLIYDAASFNFRRSTPTATPRYELGYLESVETFAAKNTILDLNKYNLEPEPYSLTSFAMHGALKYDMWLHFPYIFVDCRKHQTGPWQWNPLLHMPYRHFRYKTFDRVDYQVIWNNQSYNFVLMSAFKPQVISQEDFSKFYHSLISQFTEIVDKRNYYQSSLYFKLGFDLHYTNKLLNTYINDIILIHTKKNIKIRNSKFTRKKQQNKNSQLLLLQQTYIYNHKNLLFTLYKITTEDNKPLLFASSSKFFRSISIFHKNLSSTFYFY